MEIEQYEKFERDVKMAVAYLRNVERTLDAMDGRMPPWTWDLLEKALEVSTRIVEILPEEFFQYEDGFTVSADAIENASLLNAALDKRVSRATLLRQIAALENTTGRTPEEIKAFRCKAVQLRSKL